MGGSTWTERGPVAPVGTSSLRTAVGPIQVAAGSPSSAGRATGAQQAGTQLGREGSRTCRTDAA